MIETTPQLEHDRFDAMCRELDEYDSLAVRPQVPVDQYHRDHPDEQLDDQILAGLICP